MVESAPCCEDETRAAIAAAEKEESSQSKSHLGPPGKSRQPTEFEQAVRKVKRHVLEVKATVLSTLVDSVQSRRDVTRQGVH